MRGAGIQEFDHPGYEAGLHRDIKRLPRSDAGRLPQDSGRRAVNPGYSESVCADDVNAGFPSVQDVYKRQEQMIKMVFCLILAIPYGITVVALMFVPGLPALAVPVSYTHLDVYKRQA